MLKAWRDELTTTLLEPLALGAVGDRDQRDLDVAERGQDGLAVELQQLDLLAGRHFELAFQPEAIEQRLGQAGGDREEEDSPAVNSGFSSGLS